MAMFFQTKIGNLNFFSGCTVNCAKNDADDLLGQFSGHVFSLLSPSGLNDSRNFYLNQRTSFLPTCHEDRNLCSVRRFLVSSSLI